MSNHATKRGLKNAAGIDLSSFAKKVDLANLNSYVDKLDIDKLKNLPTNLNNLKNKADKLDVDKLVPVPVDFSKLTDALKNNVVKKDVYNGKIENIEDIIPDITNLATKTTLNAKINEVKAEIPNITNLTTTRALTAVENKIPSVCNLVKKADYNTKTNEIEKKITDHNHGKYITTPKFDKFAVETFDLRLKRVNLVSKTDIANFVKKKDFDNKLLSLNKRINSNKTKHVLVENELNELSKTLNYYQLKILIFS